MANEKYKPQIPDIMEAIFDAGYLIFDLIAGILFFAFSKGNPLFILYIWKLTFPELTAPVAVEAIIWISAIVRMVICVLPQNNWCSDEGNMKLSVIRNAVFAVTGIGVIILYAISGNTNNLHMTRMVAAIIISFGCYIPVTLFSKTKPKVGLLMIPKTCAYMWIIAMGLQLLF